MLNKRGVSEGEVRRRYLPKSSVLHCLVGLACFDTDCCHGLSIMVVKEVLYMGCFLKCKSLSHRLPEMQALIT